MTGTFAQQQDFGTDISAYPDLDPSFATMSGNRVLTEMAIRRLTTQRGTVQDDPDFGCDIRGYLNLGDASFPGSPNQATLSRIKSDIEKEVVKDQRVLSATAIVTYSLIPLPPLPANCPHITLSINADDNPFTLEIGVTSLNLTLLSTG